MEAPHELPDPAGEATLRLSSTPAWQDESTQRLRRDPACEVRPAGPEAFGPYRLEQRIGEGELGTVYRARDVVLGRKCALKVLSAGTLADPSRRERYLGVARKLAGINHPNLTSIYAIEEDEAGRLGVAMELIEGSSLAEIAAAGRFSGKPTDWIDYLIQAVRALEAAWKQGIAHGGIKPSNILLTERGLIKLTDFGFPRSGAQEEDQAAGYRSPEAWRGEAPDHRGDIFSLGASFYRLITGQLPFSGEPGGPPPPISRLTARCPLRLAQIIERMLATDPRARFRSYRALTKALEPLLPGTLEPVDPWKRGEALLLFDLLGFVLLYAVTYLGLLLFVPFATWLAGPLVLVFFYYYYYFLMRRFGQTIGKMVFRAEVHQVRGDPLLPRTLLLRFLLTYGPLLLLFEMVHWRWVGSRPGLVAAGLLGGWLLVDLATAFVSPSRRALHDYLLGTWVVRRGKARTAGADDFVEPETVAEQELEQARLRGERIGRTIVLGLLGEGGMGQVYRGYDEQLHRQVAVKVLSQKLDEQSDFYDRFIREARILANLSHANLVQVYSFGTDAERHYFTMELISGRSLSQVLALEGPIEAKTATRFLVQACRGLEAAQQCGVIHRDVKPSNMILSANGVLKMVDFGLAKGSGPGQTSTELTATGIIMGTPHYMSPEQGKGDPVDHRSDIYSLGASMFHLLTGDYPFTASTPMGIVVKHITDPLPVKRLQLRSAPEGLVRLIQKMMHKDPAERFQSYRQVIETAERLLPGQFVRAGFWSRAAALLFDVLFGLAGWLAGLAVVLSLAIYDIRHSELDPTDADWARTLISTAEQLQWFYLLLGSLPAIYTLVRLWQRKDTPGMAKVDLRLARTSGQPLGPAQRFAWFFLAPELYLILLALAAVGSPPLAALLLLAPLVSAGCAVRYGRSLGEWATRSYLVYR